MKRPQQQIVSDAGERQMRSIFEPLGWAVRKLEKDNGIDFDIEVFDNFRSVGVFFKVQLKSSEWTRYSESKEFISQRLEISNAEYLCREVRLPVVVIHADIKAGRTFWYAPQLINQELQESIAQNNRNSIYVTNAYSKRTRRYSQECQEEENQRHLDYMKRFAMRTGIKITQ